ncbi:MAG: FecR domain-containing protein [Bacteroidota bacterium]
MKISPKLLKKYANGDCSEEERLMVKQWLEDNNELSTTLPKDKLDQERALAWSQISENIQIDRSAKVVPLHRRISTYAAAAVILLTVGFFSYRIYFPDDIGMSTGQSIALKTIHTQRGEKRTLNLSDGSTIRMNYETEIRVPEQFQGDERIVYLTGHAHFDVVRDEEKPFIIYTEDSKTQVLGTSFDINTKQEGETEIIVTSGKVAFSDKDQEHNPVKLTLNNRAVLGADNRIVTDEVDASTLTAWKENRMVFNGETLKEIIGVLEPWYDVKITVQDSQLLDQDFKFSKKDPPLDEVLDRLSFLGSFNYQIDGNKVVLF